MNQELGYEPETWDESGQRTLPLSTAFNGIVVKARKPSLPKGTVGPCQVIEWLTEGGTPKLIVSREVCSIKSGNSRPGHLY